MQTRITDLSRLHAADLTGAGLVTASALLDLLTGPEVEALVATCVHVGCPALFTLSVTGHVELDPADEHDLAVAAAFDVHQRRTVAGRMLLGPDAAAATAAAFAHHGWSVRTASSPWRLGPERAELTEHWLRGWVAAAVEQDPGLRDAAGRALGERLRIGVRATVAHRDLLAMPAEGAATPIRETRPS